MWNFGWKSDMVSGYSYQSHISAVKVRMNYVVYIYLNVY
jgi:hypothetical protein